MYCKVIATSLVLVIPFLTTLIYWSRSTGLEVAWREYVQYVQFQPSNTKDPKMKTILLWNPLYGRVIAPNGFSWEGHQHTDLRDFGCDQESYKCTITTNRSYLTDERLYDGLVFLEGDIDLQDIPDQDKRGVNQVYIFQTFEAPIHALSIYSDIYSDPVINSNFFNVTMTYSSQSEIHIPYGKIVKVASHPSGEELDLFIRSFGEENARNVTLKTPDKFFAIIFASNCASHSQREQMVADLQRMVPVDLFGACGAPSPVDGTLESMIQQINKYQFYLSFENSFCNDYVTQRFFPILQADVIPVVLNGANMSQIAPKHSYIDVKDFATIRDLGNYLKKVSSDPALYASYFWWRQHYEVNIPYGRHSVKMFCEVCHYLHSGKGPSMVEDLKKEWFDGGQCKNGPNISYIGEEDNVVLIGDGR